jgi:hypothetical protein
MGMHNGLDKDAEIRVGVALLDAIRETLLRFDVEDTVRARQVRDDFIALCREEAERLRSGDVDWQRILAEQS